MPNAPHPVLPEKTTPTPLGTTFDKVMSRQPQIATNLCDHHFEGLLLKCFHTP